ncbi:hypothetical protein [Pantoea sp. PGP6]
MQKITSAVATPSGVSFGIRTIGFSGVIRQLDAGKYDKPISDGLHVLSCIQDAMAAGWLSLAVEKEIVIWRWLVVATFIIEEKAKNGTVDVQNEDGGVDQAVIYRGVKGSMSIYPGPERVALITNMEMPAITKYGVKNGLPLLLQMYKQMLTMCPQRGFRISEMGRTGLNMLHDDFIEELNTNGMPAMPVMH